MQAEKIEPGIMHKETLARLRARSKRIKLAHIAEDTGLPYTWLWTFEKGKIADPSVNRIEILKNYLIANKIGA